MSRDTFFEPKKATWGIVESGPTRESLIASVPDEQQKAALQAKAVLVAPINWGTYPGKVFDRDSLAFAKKVSQADQRVGLLPLPPESLHLHADEVWIRLLQVVGATAFDIAVALVASYLYDRCKGDLRGTQAHVEIAVEGDSGKVTTLKYDGPAEDFVAEVESGNARVRVFGGGKS